MTMYSLHKTVKLIFIMDHVSFCSEGSCNFTLSTSVTTNCWVKTCLFPCAFDHLQDNPIHLCSECVLATYFCPPFPSVVKHDAHNSWISDMPCMQSCQYGIAEAQELFCALLKLFSSRYSKALQFHLIFLNQAEWNEVNVCQWPTTWLPYNVVG